MGTNKIPGDAYEHIHGCRAKHKKGHWCWTDAEIESLKYQASQGTAWNVVAKTFTINGFVRHDALQSFRKWCAEFRDPTAQDPMPTMPVIKIEDDDLD